MTDLYADEEPTYILAQVQMQSTSGMYAQYEGHVDVWVQKGSDDIEVFRRAVRELQRTSFPDRSAGCWRMLSWEPKKQS